MTNMLPPGDLDSAFEISYIYLMKILAQAYNFILQKNSWFFINNTN